MMRIKNIIYLWMLFALPLVSVSQVTVGNPQLINTLKESPQESVFVHYNSSFLLAGEYFYYKAYVRDKRTLAPSEISKVAYVELRGQDGEIVFRHKIGLEGGSGKGDFFISTNVRSGNYKLLGYTRWMLNGDKKELFQGDVVVVNPYTNDQEALLASHKGNEPLFSDNQSSNMTGDVSGQNGRSGDIKDLKTYGKRQRVELILDGMQQLDPRGDYSVSVRKLVELEVPEMTLPTGISGSAFPGINRGEDIYLPELRGELFTGKLEPKEGIPGLSLANRRLAMSIPGQNFILKISRTNEKGQFFFNVEDYNLSENVILQVLGEEKEKFIINLDSLPKVETANLNFKNFQLTSQMQDVILKESVYNQIENGYYSVKPDTMRLPEQKLPFYGNRMLTYNLDDYTRFNSLNETFVEIVREITISGGRVLRIRGNNPEIGASMPPLLIVDGIIVQDHARLINFPAKRIQSIGVISDKYFYGPEVFHGIINIETVERDFQEKLGEDYHHTTTLLRPQPEKRYFKQTYSGDQSYDRTPDFRRQLLWQPEFTMDDENIEFYTSDVGGEYEVILQGFTSEGKGLILKANILVK